MSKTVKIGAGLFVLGLVGIFCISELCVAYSVLWDSVVIISLLMLVTGVAIFWVEWGGRRKR
ncbi:hypothetical protein ACFLVO_05120 [Chloroflexota bacterium]